MSCYCACRLTIKPVCFLWVNKSIDIDDGALKGSVIKAGGITSGTTKNQSCLRHSQHLYIQRKHSQPSLIKTCRKRVAGNELGETFDSI